MYYKHAIEPCGQRRHLVQEKTVLVGYSCGHHLSHGHTVAPGEEAEVKDLVYDTSDSSDGSDDERSIFSAIITLSRGTSFVTVGEDTIQEILQVLLDDPLLRWDKLMSQHEEDRSCSEIKDVRFFLRTFEMDLRANSDNTLEHHTCSFLHSRIRYLSSQICERFRIPDFEDADVSFESTESLQVVTVETPDPTLMPPFAAIRNFLFCGDPYRGLKDNIRNFTQTAHDPFGEMLDILTKNIHPPEKILRETCSEDMLCDHISTFLSALIEEAAIVKLSASDIAGIKSLGSHVRKLATKARLFWASESPVWHFYPPVISTIECASSNTDDMLVEANAKYESYEVFVVSSRAFLILTMYLTEPRMSMTKAWALDLAFTIRFNIPVWTQRRISNKFQLIYYGVSGNTMIAYATANVCDSPAGNASSTTIPASVLEV